MSTPKHRPGDAAGLTELTESTIGHYQDRAELFWQGTKDHDVSQNIDALLRHLAGPRPQIILDFGCGPGRDLLAFRAAGHEPVGLDLTPAFVQMARRLSGCEVLEQNFLALDLDEERFDGVFANASLFHVPTQELPRVLAELHRSLRPGGILFASNPRGDNIEGFVSGGARYGSHLSDDRWRDYFSAAGFTELESYGRPSDVPVAEQAWFASVWQK